MKFKIITPFLLQACKTPEKLKQMIELLPDKTDPTDKRNKDIAFSVEWFEEFPDTTEGRKEMDEQIRQTFTNYPKLQERRRKLQANEKVN